MSLSDGAHTGENIGLYPLLQRRCKVIIASDAERDPEYVFTSLTTAIQQIYTDENVYVDIDLEQIRPHREDIGTRSHMVVGRIQYPDCRDDHGDDGRDAPGRNARRAPEAQLGYPAGRRGAGAQPGGALQPLPPV